MADLDRPLAPRGRRAAELMASFIAAPDFVPDRILCSPARRTRETMAPLLHVLGDTRQVSIVDELYEPPSGNYRDAIAAHGGSARSLLIIGHNPAIHATALGLIGSGDERAAYQLAAKFPTAALAVVDFETRDWSRIKPKSGRLAAFVRPRDLAKDEASSDDD